MTFADFIRLGTVNKDVAQFLDVCMFLGKNILVSGGTGSGKTTLLGSLCNRIPKGQRIIVIEDSSELTIDYEHVVRFETRMANTQGHGAVTMRDLLISSLRLRPDRIIVGEVRGNEALELINAMNTGHKGCLGTIHANSPHDALVRLEGLALGAGQKMSEKALQYQISSAIDMVVQISRIPDGSRRIVNISEIAGLDDKGNYIVESLFDLTNLQRQADGHYTGELLPTGRVPSFWDEIVNNRIPLQKSKFERAA